MTTSNGATMRNSGILVLTLIALLSFAHSAFPYTTTHHGISWQGVDIGGKNFLVPCSWSANFQSFATMYGDDFATALMKPTGKRDSQGNALFVWQDYVAGTDPTKEEDVFTASITFDGDGKPVVSYIPELSEPETAKRIYRTFGKVRLNDKDWTPVPAGEETNYNFFKVTVEMK